MKRTVNYKMGALKRKFKTGKDAAPGTFISKVNEMKETAKIEAAKPVEKLGIIGLV